MRGLCLRAAFGNRMYTGLGATRRGPAESYRGSRCEYPGGLSVEIHVAILVCDHPASTEIAGALPASEFRTWD